MRKLSLALLIGLLGLSAACGDDAPSNNTSNNNVDMSDAGGDQNNDNNQNNQNNLPDMAEDMPVVVDNDDDGILNVDDNCPDTANPEQDDRDRDGVGDACDNFMYVHAPDNPDQIETFVEGTEANDVPSEGEQYGATPQGFIAQGTVSAPVGTDEDVDFFSFEITEPTAMILRLEGSETLWPAAIVAGYDFRNSNVSRIGLGADAGESKTRELYLPVPGRYTLAISDLRNFVASAANVGGDDFTYSVSISMLPLPASEAISLPTAVVPKVDDGMLHVFEVDTTGLDGLRVKATGIGLDANAFLAPALAIVDTNLDRALALSASGQVTDTNTVSLDTFLGERESVLVVEDYIQRAQTTSSSLEFSNIDLSTELETPQDPQDERISNLPWLVDGVSMNATIGPPRVTGPTSLDEDADYFLFTAKRGESIRLTVTPAPSSSFVPYLEVGPYVDQSGSFLISSHRSEEPLADGSAKIDFIYTAEEDGEAALYVRHLDNRFSSTPVGGPNYGYTVTMETFDPAPTNLGDLPALGAVTVENGGLGVIAFNGTAGDVVSVSIDNNALFVDSRLYSSTGYELLGTSDDKLVARLPDDGVYWFDIRDVFGRPTPPNEPIPVTITKATIEDFGALPGTQTGLVDVAGKTAYYRVAAMAGETLDIRVAADFLPDLQVYDEDFLRVTSTLSRRTQLRAETDTTFIVSVTGYNDQFGDDFDWTLGVEVVQPTILNILPASESGVLDNEPFARWYQMNVMSGGSYSVEFSSANPAVTPSIYVLNAADMRYVESDRGTARWISGFDGLVWVAIYDSDHRGAADFDYAVTFDQLNLQPVTLNQQTNATLQNVDSESVFSFSITEGMVSVEVEAIGDWQPRVSLLDAGRLDRITDATVFGSRLRYAVSEPADYAVAISVESASFAGPYTFNLTPAVLAPTSPMADTEPNDTQAEAQTLSVFPTVVDGSIGTPDAEDRFALDLVAGQRIWALGTDSASAGIYSYNGRIRVHDPADTEVANDTYSGEGFYPAIYGFQVPTSGQYSIGMSPTNMNFAGSYYMYVDITPAVSLAEVEPNDTTGTAQVLPDFEVARVSSSLTATDLTDVFRISITHSGTPFTAFLENASDGHTLRLLDAASQPLAESGMAFDSMPQPAIQATLSAGTYYVEFARGAVDVTADVILQAP